MIRCTVFVSLVALLVAVVSADLKFSEGDASKTVLASFGEASTTISLLYKGSASDADVSVSSSSLFSVGAISSAEGMSGYTNFSIPLTFDKGVGSTTYTVSVGSETVTGSLVAAGFVILADGKVVSGDDGEGVSVGQKGTTMYEVKAVGTDGRPVDISGTTITGRELSGPYMKEIDMSRTSISSDKFTLTIAPYRVGTGNFIISFDTPAISMSGESFETVLNVKQATTPTPPCVAYGGSITTSGGMVMIRMYNLLSPPRSTPVSKITLSVAGTSVDYDAGSSSLSLPDQTVAFKTSAAGTASISCDGADAVVMGGDIELSGDSSAPALATSLVTDAPESDSMSTLSAVISVVDSDPAVLTRAAGEKLLAQFCSTVGSSSCAIVGIRKGSALCDMRALVDPDDAEAADEALVESFAECKFQQATGYECDKLKLGERSLTKAVVGTDVGAASGGLATWTIVLIAGVGAFALILVIVLGLYSVYRRSAEQSESDYSSSGPLGVPDPSDLLYEQSIVRDIYGRGDFPDGGPSAAVAEQRAREADLREETPRPPSSSGLSRSAATDDASSTYSV
ncbi:hypothetical protein BWQ96_05476 [Gracilariopsis chorda]|uniref:Uncharacterized protein n=1 Tax=Gracilariopsis chorda TaxID=448386 RepID=A0A2V3IRQ5_9FLOR|nr:hypothetical protein BWQ96_05476 [Gracilariopsis chorda]|eukprot:PXF44806.1 hypothetical protein BWQ96_05476 [Gracilariopsis chorda]